MLAVDMVLLAERGEYDAAYLLSADGDFTPAVRATRELGRKVYVASAARGPSLQPLRTLSLRSGPTGSGIASESFGPDLDTPGARSVPFCDCTRTNGPKRRGVAQSGSAPALGAGGRRFESSRPDRRSLKPGGCSSMVELQPSKLAMGVRFPSPALRARSSGDRAADF